MKRNFILSMLVIFMFGVNISTFAAEYFRDNDLIPIKEIEFRYKFGHWVADDPQGTNHPQWQYILSQENSLKEFIRISLRKFVGDQDKTIALLEAERDKLKKELVDTQKKLDNAAKINDSVEKDPQEKSEQLCKELANSKNLNIWLTVLLVLIIMALASVFVIKKCQAKKAPSYTQD